MGRRLFLRIEYDSDAEDPCKMDGFKLYSFRRKHSNYCDPEKLPLGQLAVRSKLKAGTAFWLDYYEHTGSMWSLAGTGMQCRWDTSKNAGILIWEQPIENLGSDHTYDGRKKQAESFLAVYNDWMNGNCFWYQLQTETEEDVDSCGGFIGSDHLVSVLNSEALKPDDVVVLRRSRDLDLSYIKRDLKCRVLDTSYFPTQPQPEYCI